MTILVFIAACMLGKAGVAAADDQPIVETDGGVVFTELSTGGAAGAASNGGAIVSRPAGNQEASARCYYRSRPTMDDPGPPMLRAYTYMCTDGRSGAVVVPDGANGPAAVPQVTPGQLAQRALNALTLPAPAVGMSPRADEPGRFQLVNFPSWWWVTNWEPLVQRTELGPVWAEVTATPLFSVFDGGQGDSARCDGAGMAWRRGLLNEDRRACTYTYKRSAEQVTARVTVTWRVSWVGSGGSGGTFPPLQQSTAIPLTVYERQAVNVPFGSDLPA